MSNNTTKSDTSVKVINNAQAEDILHCFRTLHGKVLTALQGCDITAQFNSDFSKCGPEDYKALHQQSRALLNAKATKEWNDYIGSIKTALQGVIDTYMVEARADKEEYDKLPPRMQARCPWVNVVKIPFSALVGCFPQGKAEGEILVELDKLFPRQVGKGAGDVFFLTVPFKAAPAPTKTDKVEENAPVSGEVPASKAA